MQVVPVYAFVRCMAREWLQKCFESDRHRRQAASKVPPPPPRMLRRSAARPSRCRPRPACRDYLTGFHKRKVARRKEALKKLEKRQREQRLEERAEVREGGGGGGGGGGRGAGTAGLGCDHPHRAPGGKRPGSICSAPAFGMPQRPALAVCTTAVCPPHPPRPGLFRCLPCSGGRR